MKFKLNIQNYIYTKKNWEVLISQKPYSIEVKHKNIFNRDMILLKYNLMNEPDFSIQMVKECRGLILDANTLDIISYPFDKFLNYGEQYCDEIDWSSAHVDSKIDGSIIKIVKLDNDLLISTNGCIDAFDCNVSQDQDNVLFKNYGEIVISILISKFGNLENFKNILDNNHTYMFELVSPFTKVVIPYENTDMYLIGIRDNNTCKEIYFREHVLSKYFKTPESHDLHSINECIKHCENMPWNEEGYVVVDKDFHRIKVKSFAYLAVHRLANNGVMTYSRALDLIRLNECDEVLTYFPEFKKIIDKVKNLQDSLIKELNDTWEKFKIIKCLFSSRKEQAEWIIKYFKYPGCGFEFLDNKISNSKQWLDKFQSWKVIELLKLHE